MDQHWIGRLLITASLAAGLLAAGCGGGGEERELLPPTLNTSVDHPKLIGGLEQRWSVRWSEPDYGFGGYSGRFIPPYTVAWDFGGGAEPNTLTSTPEEWSGSEATVTMLNASAADSPTYTATVTITDYNGLTKTESVDYTVGPAYIPPEITYASYDLNTLTLSVAAAVDPRGLPVGIKATPCNGSHVVASQTDVLAGVASASYTFALDDPFTSASGNVVVSFTDNQGCTVQQAKQVYVPARWMSADTLFVLPQTNTATVADTATIVLVTSATAYPFYYAQDLCITFPDWVHYAPYSLNPGSLGGGSTEPDGVWGADGVDADTVLITANQDVIEAPVPGATGRNYICCNVLPAGGHTSYGLSGPLFSFQVSFDHAGTASFGLLPPSTGALDRTYYRDEAGQSYAWGMLLANADGSLNDASWDNTIVVTE